MLNMRISDFAQQANDFSLAVAYDFSKNNAEALYKAAVEAGMDMNGRILMVDKAGIVQVDSFSLLNGMRLTHSEVQEVLTQGKDFAYGFHKVNTGEEDIWCLNCVSAISQDTEALGAVVLVQSVQDIMQMVHDIQWSYYVIYFLVMLVLLVLLSLLIDYLLKALGSLKAGTEAIAQGDFSRRMKVEGRDELATLAEAFNVMAQRLEDVDRSRSEFIANASHELKTPLTSMKILTESILYEDGMDENVYKEFLGDIDQEIDRMTAMINDLLLMTRLQNIDESRMYMEKASLASMVDGVVKKLQPIAEQKWISVYQHIQFEGAIDCLGVHLRHAISNLVENAIKYTGEGGRVDITILREGSMAVVRVKDTGEGIAKKEQEKIFERFYRVSKSRTRETGGTGLGLHIVQTVALLHNGHIAVESEEGKGSTFILSIPVNADKERSKYEK